MYVSKPPPRAVQPAHRFFGLDIHKHYLVAIGVDSDGEKVYGPRRLAWADLEDWRNRTLTPQDAVVIEMTTNTWQVYDELEPHVHSVTVVHPPHVALITRAQVMTDKIAAFHLARLHAKGLLSGIWIPPQEVRDWRAIVAQRQKMVRLATQAKNRLHAVLHRYHLLPPEGNLFHSKQRDWWLRLPISPLEKVRLYSDLETLAFSQQQTDNLEACLVSLAAQDERTPLLIQLPGISVVAAMTILAAIGDIARFPEAKKLVGYAGLGARIHDSGLTTHTGRITKSGRKDLRAILVEAAHIAANTHPHWKAELARLEPHLGYNKSIIAIARKLLVAVWHVLTYQCVDRHAEPVRLARKFMQTAYVLGKANRPSGQSPGQYVRQQLDRLGIGAELTAIPWGVKKPPLPLPPPG